MEEEIKLAARPQIYIIVLNLPENAIVVKGRGIELHRLPMTAWWLTHEETLDGIFHLRARPPMMRPKAAPSIDALPPVIEVNDMPQAYDLAFDSGLTMTVAPAAHEHPWLWARSLATEWWARLASFVPFCLPRSYRFPLLVGIGAKQVNTIYCVGSVQLRTGQFLAPITARVV
ncbi:MAG: hypothetical protein ACREJU_09520 [Nitrospiraceae bacterium]